MTESLFCNFIKKESLAQVFSCEFCEISKNTFLQRTPLVAASIERMKYFRVSIVTVKSLIFLLGNREKDKHKPCERKRRR